MAIMAIKKQKAICNNNQYKNANMLLTGCKFRNKPILAAAILTVFYFIIASVKELLFGVRHIYIILST